MSLLQAIQQLCQNFNIDSKSILKTINSQLNEIKADSKGKPCNVDGCKVQRCTKPKSFDGKIVCSTHFKILSAKKTKLTAPKCMHIHTHGPKSGLTCTSKSVVNGYCNRHQKQNKSNMLQTVNFDLLDTFKIVHSKLRAFMVENKVIGYVDKRYGFVFQSDDSVNFKLAGIVSTNNFVPLSEMDKAIVSRFEKKIFF